MSTNGTIVHTIATVILSTWIATAAAQPPRIPGQPAEDGLAIIKTDTKTGFSNAGWKYDRYTDLPSLDAGKRMIVADLQGPGIIRHIHTTRHHPPELTARGIVLEVYFDDAEQPAVHCPLADFFGDGCNGKSMFFSTPLVECAPWSYNCYLPMPFKKSAKVVLRNDTPQNVMNYSYVEWEPLPTWNKQYGYFHATWKRNTFQLSKDTEIEFFHVDGAGHILGRQLSVATNEPLFHKFNIVMEGNNEIDIDGQPRAIDYLGTEDSFTFSWGFQDTFAGLHAGMPFIAQDSQASLSIYRFHDHQPIRFQKQLTWKINWREERGFTKQANWAARVAADGCWMQYDSVFYWYQDSPSDYEHLPLPPLKARQQTLEKSSVVQVDVDKLLQATPVDAELQNRLNSAEDLKRLNIDGCYAGTHPFWIDTPESRGGHPGNPNPGRRGILAVHAEGPAQPAYIARKVAIPKEPAHVLRLVVSGDPYEKPGISDFVIHVGVHDDSQLHWLASETIDAGTPPSSDNWRKLEYSLEPFAGKTIAIVVKVAYGGQTNNMNEEAFIDEISVVPQE